ncbi:Wzz/FepE/Etk N-terminal domain-containing protein [Nocardioides plantarum]|uniref:Wzz/FepE/Etk N-terminal domain-containing protein n=1 Tax=Nocardioides plantarum TaxID=29299 RepID=A0ABV5K7M5_9ACTN|nr:Wzz/FepE/Etk N-terminal domain-containing protein [Nocardioides plantarum]
MEPQDLLGALWRQRLLVLGVFVVVGLATVIGVSIAPKSYTASATISAAQNPDSPPATDDLDALRGTIGELANSRAVVDAVRADLDVDRSADELRRSIDGSWVEGTVLIEIVVHDGDPEVAAKIANLVASELPRNSPVNGTFVFTTTTPARPPVTYSSPNLVLAGAAGLVAGAVLACLFAVARDRRRLTVDHGRIAEEAADAPLLAHVAPPHDLTALPALYPGTAAADVFRHLRLSLEAEGSRDPVDLVVVAGVGPGEVNIWLGANLAISLASVGRRVLLVDGRLDARSGHQPSPHRDGLFGVLDGLPLEDAMMDGPIEGLSVLPSGDAQGRSAEVLIETKWGDVVAAARLAFDVIVVLAPPMDISDDARVMAASGSLLMAVPEGTVSVAALRAHSDRVRSVGGRLLGLVLVGHRAERVPV